MDQKITKHFYIQENDLSIREVVRIDYEIN
jgi:hypothetical protein